MTIHFGANRPLRIFIAEDSRFDLRDFERKIATWTTPTLIASVTDGEAAVKWLMRAAETGRFPDLVVLDLNMPRAGGIQVLSFIRNSPELRSLPVMVWTTSDSPFDIGLAKDLHVDGYLLKRDTARELQAAIHQLIAV